MSDSRHTICIKREGDTSRKLVERNNNDCKFSFVSFFFVVVGVFIVLHALVGVSFAVHRAQRTHRHK